MTDDNSKDRPRRMVTIDDVMKIVPWSKGTIIKKSKTGEFPPGHFISPKLRIWYEDELRQWQDTPPPSTPRRPPGKRPKPQ